MNIELPPALEGFVRAQIESGRYRDESDVVGDALRLFEREQDAGWRELLEAIEEGEADLAAGRVVEVNSVEELRAAIRGA
jgi:putative addiction module CopG family antidote